MYNYSSSGRKVMLCSSDSKHTLFYHNSVIPSINFFSYDFVTIKWMDSNGKLYFRNVSYFDWTKTGKFPEINQLHGVYS